MRLEIDVGNTRLKWRLCDSQTCAPKSSIASVLLADVLAEDDLQTLFLDVDLVSVRQVYIASVVPSIEPLLSAWCRSQLCCEPVFAVVQERAAKVTNGYDDVAQMGVDRWLAMLAAYSRVGNACLVIDCGSAATVDLVAKSGVHLGGYIVPGLHMMQDALFRDTGRVKLATIRYDNNLRAGCSTVGAVAAGLPAMLVGLVGLALKELAYDNAAVTVVVTGGDGELMAGLLSAQDFTGQVVDVHWVPELVFDGLRLSIEDKV